MQLIRWRARILTCADGLGGRSLPASVAGGCGALAANAGETFVGDRPQVSRRSALGRDADAAAWANEAVLHAAEAHALTVSASVAGSGGGIGPPYRTNVGERHPHL